MPRTQKSYIHKLPVLKARFSKNFNYFPMGYKYETIINHIKYVKNISGIQCRSDQDVTLIIIIIIIFEFKYVMDDHKKNDLNQCSHFLDNFSGSNDHIVVA